MNKIKALQKIRETYQEMFKSEHVRGKLADLVDYFISTPISTIPQAKEASGLGSYSMMQNYFDKLIQYDIIEEVTGKERNRVYVASEILKILED